MIGIICAMSEERDAILKLMDNPVEKKFMKIMYHGTIMDNRYYSGKIGNKDVALFHCGVGKVYAAIITTQVINKVKPDLIINLGCAGSLNENVHVNDVVVATRVADWDVSVPGWERSIFSDKMSFACDGRVAKVAGNIKVDANIFTGYIVSGDEFIYKKSQLNVIKRYFADALAGEMEGSAIANTCYAYGVNCSVIRSISDETLVNGSYKNFDFNLLKVCDTAAEICRQIIIKY